MRNFINFLMRFVCAVALGTLLMFIPSASTKVLVGMGILFAVSGLISIGLYYYQTLRGKFNVVPFSGYGSALVGWMLIYSPSNFVPFVPKILGIFLILVCFNQLLNIVVLRFKSKVRFAYYIAPVIVLLYGIFLFFSNTEQVVKEPATDAPINGYDRLVGLSFYIYSISELVIALVFGKKLFSSSKADANATSAPTEEETAPTVDGSGTEAE